MLSFATVVMDTLHKGPHPDHIAYNNIKLVHIVKKGKLGLLILWQYNLIMKNSADSSDDVLHTFPFSTTHENDSEIGSK